MEIRRPSHFGMRTRRAILVEVGYQHSRRDQVWCNIVVFHGTRSMNSGFRNIAAFLLSFSLFCPWVLALWRLGYSGSTRERNSKHRIYA